MDTELFKMLLNLPQIEVNLVEVEEKTIRVNCTTKSHQGACPLCGKTIKRVHQYSTH